MEEYSFDLLHTYVYCLKWVIFGAVMDVVLGAEIDQIPVAIVLF